MATTHPRHQCTCITRDVFCSGAPPENDSRSSHCRASAESLLAHLDLHSATFTIITRLRPFAYEAFTRRIAYHYHLFSCKDTLLCIPFMINANRDTTLFASISFSYVLSASQTIMIHPFYIWSNANMMTLEAFTVGSCVVRTYSLSVLQVGLEIAFLIVNVFHEAQRPKMLYTHAASMHMLRHNLHVGRKWICTTVTHTAPQGRLTSFTTPSAP